MLELRYRKNTLELISAMTSCLNPPQQRQGRRILNIKSLKIEMTCYSNFSSPTWRGNARGQEEEWGVRLLRVLEEFEASCYKIGCAFTSKVAFSSRTACRIFLAKFGVCARACSGGSGVLILCCTSL